MNSLNCLVTLFKFLKKIEFQERGAIATSVASSVNNERKSRLFSKDKSSGFSLKQQKQGSSGGVTSTSHSSRGTSLTGPSASSDQSNVISIYELFFNLF